MHGEYSITNPRQQVLSRQMQSFKRVDAWRKAYALLLNAHRVLQGFPKDYASLRNQLRRSAESVPTNIVEGRGCDSQKEFARFLQHSINSADELEYQLRIAFDYGILSLNEWRPLTLDTQEVRRMTIALRKKVLSDLTRAVQDSDSDATDLSRDR